MTRTIEILERLVGFDTTSARSNLDMIDYVQAHLETCGFYVVRVPSACGIKAGLFARLGPDAAGVMLSAHSDVVPAEGQSWTHDPFVLSESEGRLYGRGTTDMKGFLASMLALAEQAGSRALCTPLKFAISYDEEVGCVGIAHMIDQLAPAIGLPRACIVGEPTQMQVAIGHKGKASYKGFARGQGGHSALAPGFVNALHVAADFVQGLRRVQAQLDQTGARDSDYAVPYSTVHAGVLTAGRALNILPDKADILFEVRHLAAESSTFIEALIDREVHVINEAYQKALGGSALGFTKTGGYPALDVAQEAELVGMARRWSGVSGTTKVAFGTEAGVFAEHGIPTIVCGPGSMEAQGHKPDEYIEKSQLLACDAMLSRVLDAL